MVGHKRTPDSFEAFLKYLLKSARRYWYSNARPRDADGSGDDEGTRENRLRAAVQYLNTDLVSIGEQKVRSMGRNAEERKEMRFRLMEFFVFERNPINEQAFTEMFDVCLKIGAEISALPEVAPRRCPIKKADMDTLHDFHSSSNDLHAEQGCHFLDYVLDAVDENKQPIFNFSRFGIKSSKEPSTPELKRSWLRQLAVLLFEFHEEATRKPEPKYLEDGTLNTEDMTLEQWQRWKHRRV